MGCTFIDAKYNNLKYVLFSMAYVIMTPIGIGEFIFCVWLKQMIRP